MNHSAASIPLPLYDVQQIIVNLRKIRSRHHDHDHNVRETLFDCGIAAYLIYEGRVESEGTKDFLITILLAVSFTSANASRCEGNGE